MGEHMVHLANAIAQSVCGGDAVLCQTTLLGRLWRAISRQCLCPPVASVPDLLISRQKGTQQTFGPCLLWPYCRTSQQVQSSCTSAQQ